MVWKHTRSHRAADILMTSDVLGCERSADILMTTGVLGCERLNSRPIAPMLFAVFPRLTFELRGQRITDMQELELDVRSTIATYDKSWPVTFKITG